MATPEDRAAAWLDYALAAARRRGARCPALAPEYEGAAGLALFAAVRRFDPALQAGGEHGFRAWLDSELLHRFRHAERAEGRYRDRVRRALEGSPREPPRPHWAAADARDFWEVRSRRLDPLQLSVVSRHYFAGESLREISRALHAWRPRVNAARRAALDILRRETHEG